MNHAHTARKLLATLLLSTLGASSVWAQTSDMSRGEIRKVDKAASKITIQHGEIKNLDMPPMTMVFQVKDPALLTKVKAGDKVRFTADKLNGAYTVMSIEPAP